MFFLHPWAILIGAIALVVPIAVHRLTKPRPQPLPLSTIQFVFEAIQQRKSQHRLRDLMVLLLRMLAIGLIAFAIARPKSADSVIEPTDGTMQVARVVVMDISASMRASRGGSQPIEVARSVADGYLQGDDGLTQGLIMVAANPEPVFEQLSKNSAALRQQARGVSCRPQSAAAGPALTQAAKWLSETDPSTRRELVVISDFQRSDWGSVQYDAMPSDTKIQLESVASPNSENLAVLEVRSPTRISAGNEFTLEVDLGNYSASARKVRLSLDLTCRESPSPVAQQIEHECSVGQSTALFAVTCDRSGWWNGSVQIIGARDDLAVDDIRPCVVRVESSPKIVLLTQQNPDAIPSSSFYLEKALTSILDATSGNQNRDTPSLVRMSPRQTDRETLEDADVVVIDHPGRIAEPLIRLLATRMRLGQGMLMFVGDLSDGVNVAAFENELGAALQLPIQFASPDSRRPRDSLRISDVQKRERPFRVFGDSIASALATIQITGGLPTKMTEETLRDRVLATLSDGSALLSTTDSGAGRISLINVDLERSNLPVQPAFLPLLGELMAVLLPDTNANTNFTCGSPVVRALPTKASLELDLTAQPVGDWPVHPDGHGRFETSATSIDWNWPRTDRCGVYEVLQNTATLAQVAVSVPRGESDLSVLNPLTIDTSQLSGQAIGFRSVRDQRRDDDRSWNWLLSACVIGLIGEICLLRWFRS